MTLARSAVDGNWTAWSSWDNCTGTCGTATRLRERNCTDPVPKGGGNDCPGAANQTQTCEYLSLCTCINPVPKGGGNDCPGAANETQTCEYLSLCTCIKRDADL